MVEDFHVHRAVAIVCNITEGTITAVNVVMRRIETGFGIGQSGPNLDSVNQTNHGDFVGGAVIIRFTGSFTNLDFLAPLQQTSVFRIHTINIPRPGAVSTDC